MRLNKYKTQIRAVKKANKDKVLSKKHKQNISDGHLFHIRGQVVASNGKQKHTFKNCAECARAIGCTRQLISQCIKHPEKYHSARGWKIQLLAKEGGAI